MSKNLFRKGLAFGSAVALGLTGISVLPANGAGQSNNSFVSLLPNGGSEYTVLLADTFELKSNQSATIAETDRDLKWLVADSAEAVEPVVNPDGSSDLRGFSVPDNTTLNIDGASDRVTITLASLSDDVALLDGGIISFVDELWADDTSDFKVADDDTLFEVSVDSAANTVSFVSNVALSNYSGATEGGETFQIVRGPRADDGSYVVNSGVDSNTSDKVLELDVLSSLDDSDDATVNVSVTAWVDDNNLGTIDDTEFASPTRSVKFLTIDELSGTASYDSVVVGDESIKAYVTTSPALNGQQSTEDQYIDIGFTYQGQSGTDQKDTTFVDGKYEHTATNSNEGGGFSNPFPVVPGSYSVTPYFNGDAIGPKVTIGAPVAVATDASGLASETKNINVTDNDTNDLELEIRSGTLTASVIYQVVDENDKPVGAGKSVRVTNDGSDLPTGAKLNGKAFASGTVLTFTTDSKGQVVFTVTATAAPVGKTFNFDAEAEGADATNVDFDLQWADAFYEIFELKNSTSDEYGDGDVSSDFARGISVGGSYSFNIAYLDQWAQGPTGDYRVEVETDYRTVSLKYYNMSNGRVNFTVSDDEVNADSEDYVEVYVEVQKKTGSTWNEASGDNEEYWYLWPYAQSNGSISQADEDLESELALATIAAGDVRASQGDNFGWESDYNDYAWLEGTVTDGTDGQPKPGAKVVISAPSNVLLIDGDRSAFGSLTVYADDDGDFAVGAISNRAQKDTPITITSLGKTVTWKTTFLPAAGDSGSVISAKSPKSILGGRTLAVTMFLKDKYGNPVDAGTDSSEMSLAYDGPGFVVTDLSTVTELGSDGAYTVRVLLSAGDTGVGTFSLSYSPTDLDNDDVISKSVAVWVGPIANARAGGKKGTLVVEAYRAKGKTVSVFVGTTRVASFVADLQNDRFVVRGLKAGDRTVRVVLSGAGEDFRGAVTIK